jgi:hypothetical protein
LGIAKAIKGDFDIMDIQMRYIGRISGGVLARPWTYIGIHLGMELILMAVYLGIFYLAARIDVEESLL